MSEINEHMKSWTRKIQDSDWPFPAPKLNVAEDDRDEEIFLDSSILSSLADPFDSHAQDDSTGYPYPHEGV